MRHHRLPLLAGIVALGLALAVANCSVSTNVGTYNVTYRANLLGVATIDTLYYSPGTGKCLSNCTSDSTLTMVINPALNGLGVYDVELSLPAGATVQATLVGHGTASGTAQFAALWMTATGTIRGDSLTAPTTAATKFTISIPKMTL
jgi:hypothetical protein